MMAKSENNIVKVVKQESQLGFAYFLCFIGAALYFTQNSVGFWGFILALLKASVWPVFLIENLFELLKI